MPNVIIKSAADLSFLRRVLILWQRGETQKRIAAATNLRDASRLQRRLAALGFRLTRDRGFRMVTTSDGRDFAEMDAEGALVSEEECVPA